MDSLRGRRQAKQPVFEDYQPSAEWSQDSENHQLRVDLPGFNKEELRVQVDNSRKLTVKARRQESDGRYKFLEKAFDVPEDSIIEKIRGRFEDGCLFLIMPKKPSEPLKQEARIGEPSQDQRKEDHDLSNPKEKQKVDEEEKKAEEDSTLKEKQKVDEEKKKEDDSTLKEKQKVDEEKKKEEEDSTPKEKQKVDEEKKKEDDSTPKEKLKNAEKKEDQNIIHGEKAQEKKENHEGLVVHKDEWKHGEEIKKKEDDPIKREGRKMYEQMKKAAESDYIGGDDGHLEKSRKKGVAKRKRKEEGEQGWLDCGLVDDLLEKINRNRKVIAVAFVAFSVGFYVSHKLRQSG